MRKKILQIDRLTNQVIMEWDSIERASKELDQNISEIKKVSSGKINTNIKDIWLFPVDFKSEKDMIIEIEKRKLKIKKEIIKKFNKGKITLQIDPNTKKVVEKWNNATAAALYYKENPTSITDNARGERLLTAGYIWIYEDDFTIKELNKRIKKYRKSGTRQPCVKNSSLGKPLLQIDGNTGYIIKEWNSVNEASFRLDIINTSIRAVARDSKNMAGNYLWLYKDKFSSIEDIEKEIERRLTKINNLAFSINRKGYGYKNYLNAESTIPILNNNINNVKNTIINNIKELIKNKG